MSSLLDRRQVLTGAGGALIGLVIGNDGTRAAAPIRIQIPDLAFARALENLLTVWTSTNSTAQLTLALVPPEPASASLLNDARMQLNQFAGALVPVWTIPDLVRDDFIVPVSPPPIALPRSVAHLRSFGGEWVTSDFDHSCDLLYWRTDLLARSGFAPAESWDALVEQAVFLMKDIGGGIALPQTHAQQVVDHFVSMAASFVVPDVGEEPFWFDPETMTPAIVSERHQQALEQWRALARTTPTELRAGSTGDLWEAFLAGRTGYLIASTDFLSYAIERGVDTTMIGIGELPGVIGNDSTIRRVGNTTGAAWGGVIMRAAGDVANQAVRAFFEWLAAPETQAALWSDPSTGITPASGDQTNLDRLREADWAARTAADWLAAIDNTVSNAVQLPPLRIAETRRYLQALENHIVPFLVSSGDDPATEALTEAANDWDAIDIAIGIATQQELYARSLMPVPDSN